MNEQVDNSISKRRPKETWLKRRLPKSLFGRTLLIITLPIALMQIIVVYIFFNAHWQTVTATLSNSVAADISIAVELYDQDANAQTADMLDEMMRPHMQLSIAFEKNDKLPTSTRSAFFSTLDKTLGNALANNIEKKYWFDTTRYPNHIDIRVVVDGGVLRFIVPRERVFAPTGYIFLLWLIMATLLLSLVSILFTLNQARPIVRLAQAAENFGKGRSIGKFKPTGAAEVRQAGHAFLEMRERISRHIQQRTALLAGVSHDLRTPLTRLKLHFAMEKDTAETKAAKQDINDMEHMLDGYLNFARGIADEDMQNTNLNELLTAIINAHAPKPTLNINESININVRQSAMKRALSNLVDNAVHYGQSVLIKAKKTEEHLHIIIEDDGPGIKAQDRAQAILPFMRLDHARNQNRKGVGLGLSIANDIIQAHGGVLTLSDAKDGGLQCKIQLPI